MKKYSPLTISCNLIFLAGVVALLLGRTMEPNTLHGYVLLVVSIVYLLAGWYILRGYYSDGHPLLLFFYGYIYASVFMTFTFQMKEWPLAGTFLYLSPLWAVLQLLITFAIRKKIPREGFIQFLIEGGIMFLLIVFLIIKG